MKKVFALILAVLMLGSLLAGCGASHGDLMAKDELIVYTNANFPPFEYMLSNEMAGVDIDLANAIGEKLGKTITLKNADFDGIITALASGKCDIAISGFTITEKRQKKVDFSDPYIKSVQYLVLPAGSNIATMEDLAGKRVGSPLGYTGQFVMDDEIAEGVLVDAGTTVVTYKNAVDGSLNVVDGRIDAMIMDEFVAKKIASDNDALIAIPLVYANGDEISEEYGVAIPKGQDELKAKINEIIAELKADGIIESWVIAHSSTEPDEIAE